MSSKTSDKNVVNVEEDVKVLKDLMKELKLEKQTALHNNEYGEYITECDVLDLYDMQILALQHILAEREQMTKRYEERDDELYERVKQCNNLQTEIDRLYLDKEELIELNRKQARQIQELEAKLEFKKFGDLDNVEFEEYMSQFIPKQVVIDKIEELNEEFNKINTPENDEWYIDSDQYAFAEDILQELLKGEK